MSERSTLCLVNATGHQINVQVIHENGFQSDMAPSRFLNDSMAPNTSLCGYVEMVSGSCPFTLEITFEDNKGIKQYLTFSDDQIRAKVKQVGLITPEKSPSGFEIWRSSGGDVSNDSHGTNGIYIRSVPPPDHSGWMGALQISKPDITLNQVVMPGSHDAGMYITKDYNLGGGKEWAKTQHLSMLEQLRAGSRYFDLRIWNTDGHLRAYHGDTGYGAYGASLSSILRDVETFLDGEKSADELVILKFSHKTNDAEGIVNKVKTLGDRLYRFEITDVDLEHHQISHLAHKKLSDLKGNVLAVFDDQFKDYWSVSRGILPYYDTDTNPTETKPVALTVYDNYANDGTYEEMSADQKTKVGKYAGLGQEFLFLLSWTITGGGAVSDIEVLAGMANPWLPRELSALKKNGMHVPNIVYIDFVDPYLCRAILDLNE